MITWPILTNEAYLSAIAVTNISKSFYLQDGDKNQLEQNYVTVALCVTTTEPIEMPFVLYGLRWTQGTV